MTLGRLMELYVAEMAGKQIMLHICTRGYLESTWRTPEITLKDCALSDLVNDGNEEESHHFFIKDEEDVYGNKLTDTQL